LKFFAKIYILLFIVLFSTPLLFAQALTQGGPFYYLSSISPTSGKTGDTILLIGTGLTNTFSVNFGGTPATSFAVVSDDTVKAVVGAGSTGEVTITVIGHIPSLPIFPQFTFISSPTITSFTPSSGGNGASITIKGTGFTNADTVEFGGVLAQSFTVLSDTTITAVVGNGSTGNISVVTPVGGTGILAGFTFLTQDNWTGAVNTAWEDPGNWSLGVIPDSTMDVVINSGIVLLNSNATVKSLTLNPIVNFTVGTGYTLTITH
jgi:hypothetical protein